ncbi:hypothetical protein [Roseovarius arcticus]|uniref:hypothetical protein n=1 Tax=Roseovarius arcticus TaxID=2547404 RepID=UPI001485C3CD|nr:hypothetical protein [Roseovarius arcticus]
MPNTAPDDPIIGAGLDDNSPKHTAPATADRNSIGNVLTVIFQSDPIEKLFLRFDLTHHCATLHFNMSIESGPWQVINHIL